MRPHEHKLRFHPLGGSSRLSPTIINSRPLFTGFKKVKRSIVMSRRKSGYARISAAEASGPPFFLSHGEIRAAPATKQISVSLSD